MRSMRWLLSMGLGLGLVGTVGAQMRQGVAQAELTGSVMGKVACDDANVPARFARVTLDPVPLAADATKAQATGLGAGLGADVGSGVISGSAGVTVTTVTTTVETALDGSFSMPKVKAGEYYVNIEKEGYITAKSMFTAKVIANPTPEVKAILDKVLHRIKVEVGQTTQVEVRLERGAAVGGTVLYDDGSPAGEMQLKLLHKDTTGRWVPVSNYGRKYGAGISTDDRGRYRVASLLADEYMLEADMSLNDITAKSSGTEGRRMNFVMSNSRSSLSFYGPGAVTMAEATSFTLRAGQERTGEDLTIPLAKLHKLTGRVAAGRLAGYDGDCASEGGRSFDRAIMVGRALQVNFGDDDARVAGGVSGCVWFGVVQGHGAGDQAVERGPVRHDAEGLDGWGIDSERWTAGGGAGDFPAV